MPIHMLDAVQICGGLFLSFYSVLVLLDTLARVPAASTPPPKQTPPVLRRPQKWGES